MNKQTALHLAALNGDKLKVCELISKNSDPFAGTDKSGLTLLHVCVCVYGNTERVRSLLPSCNISERKNITNYFGSHFCHLWQI